mgnify:CR=1 FL=1
MTLHLTKHHGLGNDFLVTFHPDVAEADLAELARTLCDRRRGIGADGLLIGESAPGHAARMVLYNADGSRAEMSGNGIRCFAQALAMRRGTVEQPDLAEQVILTDAGDRLVTFEPAESPGSVLASVDMGEVGQLAAPAAWESLGCHDDRPVAHLSLGNPHSVVGVDDVDPVEPRPGWDPVRWLFHTSGSTGDPKVVRHTDASLLAAAKAWAWLTGSDGVTPDHVQRMVLPVWRHRIALEPEAELEGVSADSVLRSIMQQVQVPI